MNHLIVALALSFALVACSHTSEQDKHYTVTYSEKMSFTAHEVTVTKTRDDTVIMHLAYVLPEYAHNWEEYKRATHEVCSRNPDMDCSVIWFDGVSPQTEDEIEKWDELESNLFVQVADLSINDKGEIEGSIDCERIDAPEAQKTRGDPFKPLKPVQCDAVWEEIIRHLDEAFPPRKQN